MRHCFGFVIASLLSLSTTSAFAAEEWPQFCGPNQQGVSAATGVPIQWSSTKNVAWKIDLPGQGWSSPVLAEGKTIWKQSDIKYSPVHGNGGSPALIDGTLIFICDGAKDPFVVGLDAANGQIRWKTPRGTHAKKTFSFATPLAVQIEGKSLAILPGSGFIGAYEPASGREIWRVKYNEGYSGVPRPVYSHGLIYVSSGFDQPIVYAITA